jgi:REP element-mobilizing transposase RayT
MPYARKDMLTWQEGMYYHIYNRGAGKETIFRDETNFLFAIEKIKVNSQANKLSMIAYCLMPNHYHFLIRQDGESSAGKLPQYVFNSYTKTFKFNETVVHDIPVNCKLDRPYSISSMELPSGSAIHAWRELSIPIEISLTSTPLLFSF